MLERQTDKINRQVNFMYAPPFDPVDSSGKNNKWLYDRAPDGYKFVLERIQVSSSAEDGLNGIFALFDGHEYTHWNLYPGVESREYLTRFEINTYMPLQESNLSLWECKEMTLAIRSRDIEKGFKVCAIVWYYLRKMNWLEKLQYAVIQPRGQRYRKGGATTVERDEL